MLTAQVYATRVEAQRAIDAIDAARGPTEVLTRDGTSFVAPRKTWAHPIPLRAGTYAVPWKADRLRDVEDAVVTLDGATVRTARARDAVTITDGEREPASDLKR